MVQLYFNILSNLNEKLLKHLDGTLSLLGSKTKTNNNYLKSVTNLSTVKKLISDFMWS